MIMKTIVINGESGSGKSYIAHKLVLADPEKYNLIRSYTSRPMRNVRDDDHIFKPKKFILTKMMNYQYVARSIIDDEIYCTFYHQFRHDRINLCILDDFGVLDILNHFKAKQVRVVRVKRDGIEIPSDRRNRLYHFIPDDCPHIDRIVYNNDDYDPLGDDTWVL